MAGSSFCPRADFCCMDLGGGEQAFSKAAGPPQRREKMNVLYESKSLLESWGKHGIIEEKTWSGGAGVHKIGKLDFQKFKAFSSNMTTDEVIITDERIAHIKARHPNDFERYAEYIKDAVEDPSYIIEDSRPNTAMLLKHIKSEDQHFRLALRLATPQDNPDYKNSILTFLKIREKEWDRLLRNKNVLYKSE